VHKKGKTKQHTARGGKTEEKTEERAGRGDDIYTKFFSPGWYLQPGLKMDL